MIKRQASVASFWSEYISEHGKTGKTNADGGGEHSFVFWICWRHMAFIIITYNDQHCYINVDNLRGSGNNGYR